MLMDCTACVVPRFHRGAKVLGEVVPRLLRGVKSSYALKRLQSGPFGVLDGRVSQCS